MADVIDKNEPTGFYDYLPRRMKSRRTAWQKRTGLKGVGPLKEGLLKKVGYSVTASKTRRHAAVKRAVKKYGKASTIRKLNAVAVYTRRTSPAKSRKFRSDMKFAQKMKGGDRKEELQALLAKIETEELEMGEKSKKIPDMIPASKGLVTEANKLGLTPEGVKLGDLKNAVNAALRMV